MILLVFGIGCQAAQEATLPLQKSITNRSPIPLALVMLFLITNHPISPLEIPAQVQFLAKV